MATGYFKLYRPLQNHWIYQDSRYLHLWIECLINARWSSEPKTDIHKGVLYTIERGQFLFSRRTYAERLKIDESAVRRCIDLMVKDEMIKKVMSLGLNQPTVYEIVNFEKFNPSEQPSESVYNTNVEGDSNPVATQSRPSDDPVTTTKEERKKRNKVNNGFVSQKQKIKNATITHEKNYTEEELEILLGIRKGN